MTFAAPLRSRIMAIEPDWIDYNGHLNMAFYNVLFDRSSDDVFELLGVGPDYARQQKLTIFTAETHICYVQELHLAHRVTVSYQLIDHDAKRLRAYQEIRHVDGWLAATCESLSLHVDMSGPRVADFPPGILARIDALAEAHGGLPRPERAGRAIAIKRKPG
jgi:acyl-CoA thioester hydrolase